MPQLLKSRISFQLRTGASFVILNCGGGADSSDSLSLSLSLSLSPSLVAELAEVPLGRSPPSEEVGLGPGQRGFGSGLIILARSLSLPLGRGDLGLFFFVGPWMLFCHFRSSLAQLCLPKMVRSGSDLLCLSLEIGRKCKPFSPCPRPSPCPPPHTPAHPIGGPDRDPGLATVASLPNHDSEEGRAPRRARPPPILPWLRLRPSVFAPRNLERTASGRSQCRDSEWSGLLRACRRRRRCRP